MIAALHGAPLASRLSLRRRTNRMLLQSQHFRGATVAAPTCVLPPDVTSRTHRQRCCAEQRVTGDFQPAQTVEDSPDSETDIADDLRHYQQLKAEMNKTTRNFAVALSGYLMLVTSFDVAGCAAFGGLASYGYLQLLIRDVDTFRQDDPIAASFLMAEDARLELSTLRSVRRLGAAYRAALRPRLLVLVGVAASAAAFNAVATEPLSAQAVAALFGGFLSYKAGLVAQLWEATRPKFNADDLLRPPRPMITDTEKDERDLTPEEWRQRLNGRRH